MGVEPSSKNYTRDILLKDYVTLLPSEQAVLETLETVPADDPVIAACRRLKESGYTIALDDFGMNDPREALTDVADIIKVDLRETSAADAAAMVKRYGPWRCRMLTEKVETREEFMAARRLAFCTSRDISSADRKFSRRMKSRPTGSIVCAW